MNVAELAQSAGEALDKVSDELRQAGYRPRVYITVRGQPAGTYNRMALVGDTGLRLVGWVDIEGKEGIRLRLDAEAALAWCGQVKQLDRVEAVTEL